jgi:aspartyl-tRNA(Asn)/glutamyl-tRNA(Gln) amidotransferase subunit A
MTSPTQHLDDCLDAIARQSAVADVALLRRRDDAARTDAAALSGAVEPSSVRGLVMAVKACFDVAGWVTHSGSAVLADAEPAATDADLVARLRRAGVVLLAQSNMTEFAYGALGPNPHYGTPTTPLFDIGERVSGGSTSGGAVAVATGMVDIAVGSDTSGSVRIPAAFCGVAGFKPSKGRYPEAGLMHLSPTFDVPGIIATSAAMCGRVDAAIIARNASPQPMDRCGEDLGGLTFGVPHTIVEADLDPPVGAAFEAWLTALSGAGARLVDAPLTPMTDASTAARDGGMISAEAFMLHRDRIAGSVSRYDPRVGPRIAAGEAVPAHLYARALIELRACAQRFDAEVAEFDAILTPTVPMPPPRLTDLLDDTTYLAANVRSFRFTEFANRLDLPSLSIPGALDDRQPYGLLITGRRRGDRSVLDVGSRIERLLSRW